MIITEKIKAIVNKIQQNKVHCNLGIQAAKYDVLTGKVVLPENDLLEKLLQ